MAECRTCKAKIRWVKTEAGKSMPLDPTPRVDGNVVVRGGKGVVLQWDEDRDKARIAGEDLFVSHFATCPNAASHRNRR